MKISCRLMKLKQAIYMNVYECLLHQKIQLKFLIFNMLIKHMNVEGRINIKFLEIDEKFCIFVV